MLSIFLRAAITILCILLNIRSLLIIFRSRKKTKKNLNGGEIGLLSLPEGCIADVISQTTPSHACQLSLVSKLFKSAAESDAVWNKFLPSDYHDIIARSVNPLSIADFSSVKQLFLHLSDHHLIIDGGNKSFSLDKLTGKKCYMLSARSLTIVWGDTPRYWAWNSRPDARFDEVAELLHVWWLEIHGSINTSHLSRNTNYAAYLVYKLAEYAYGFDYTNDACIFDPAEVSVGLIGEENSAKRAVLDPEGYSEEDEDEVDLIYPIERKDGWLEVELGEYFNKSEEEDMELKMSLQEIKCWYMKQGLIVQGIEIRPKEDH